MKDTTIDRYVTFKGIDGDGNARRIVAMLRRYIDDPDLTNAFWERYKEKLALAANPDLNSGRHLDELFLVHSYINNIRELFEEHDDHEALALLEQVETESC
ncbi:N(2)-fixation sustaining protein CowN [Geobacter sp. SVR]|uniref:N(2)-fixation sustaining protein CowN n=1 Tax=Geobacter sp. SVR TaxID=2495594 RepID=UPI00143EFDA9|nr:N(2)-fixation sustaining protein CowN [Geobacter sp. SVR]BCS55061.1 N(2)-fixation sustaining protein CowN [Geobacter sp. SVR]GCF85243.1 N(2)-fixation sustaining protein CowN [Geobacter sp. SVR]